MSSENEFEIVHPDTENNNSKNNNDSLNKNKVDRSPGILDKIGVNLLRNHNWICVLMLTPISLLYDLYCICEYDHISRRVL